MWRVLKMLKKKLLRRFKMQKILEYNNFLNNLNLFTQLFFSTTFLVLLSNNRLKSGLSVCIHLSQKVKYNP